MRGETFLIKSKIIKKVFCNFIYRRFIQTKTHFLGIIIQKKYQLSFEYEGLILVYPSLYLFMVFSNFIS